MKDVGEGTVGRQNNDIKAGVNNKVDRKMLVQRRFKGQFFEKLRIGSTIEKILK